MASKIKVDQLEGSTGSTITVPAGQTFTVTDGIPVASGGTGIASFTAGDILYATGATTLTKLNKGTAEQVLAMNTGATAPDWGSVDLTVLPTITAAKGGTGQAGGFTQGDFLYATGATTLAKLAKGAATEVIAMNAGATAPEWVTAGGGTTVKRHYFTNATRTAGTAGVNDQFNFTTSFVPILPTAGNNDLWVQWISPVDSDGPNQAGFGLRFNDGSTDYDYPYVGATFVDPQAAGAMGIYGQSFHIAAGSIPAGTYTVTVRLFTTSSHPAFWNPNTTDDARYGGQTSSTIMITEYKN